VTSTLASGGGQTKGGRQTQKGKAQQQQMVASTQKQTTMQRVVLGRGGRGVTDSGMFGKVKNQKLRLERLEWKYMEEINCCCMVQMA
jgi:hypothetical protein